VKTRVVVVWCVTCLLWSSTFLFIRIGLAEIPPLTFAWLRLAIASAILMPIAIRRRSQILTSAGAAQIAVSGTVLLGVNYGLLFWGARTVPSGLVAILQSFTPVLALLIGAVARIETMTAPKVLASAMGVFGVAIIVNGGTADRSALLGSLAVVAASFCVAAAYVWIKARGSHWQGPLIVGLQSIGGMIPLAALAALVEVPPHPGHWHAATWLALLYLSVVASVVALGLNYWLLARMDASAMLMMGIAEVPIAVLLGALILREPLTIRTVIGGVLIVAAVAMTLRGKRSR
jgi:drug/metabolite transporter (DMT)-like permease